MNDIEKDALHIIAIVRALKNTQRFLGPLSAEEFADNDENRMPSQWQSPEQGSTSRSCRESFENRNPAFHGVGS